MAANSIEINIISIINGIENQWHGIGISESGVNGSAIKQRNGVSGMAKAASWRKKA